MDLPAWVEEEIQKYEAPQTGKIILEIERYMGGITKIEIGGLVRVKPPQTRAT